MISQSEPIIVKLTDPPSELSGLADVLLGSLAITGILLVAAVAFGLALGAVMYWIRSRSAD